MDENSTNFNKKSVYTKIKCAFLALASVMMLIPTNAVAADISSWAEDDYINASSAGLISYNVVTNNLQDYITRDEFCELALNLYIRITGDNVTSPRLLPFEDSTNTAVAKAYKLGIVAGDENGNFNPKNNVKRQEMAQILVNTLNACDIKLSLSDKEKVCVDKYSDKTEISNWATNAIATSLKYGIITGVSDDKVDPLGNATREQAIIISNRSYNTFSQNINSIDTPSVVLPKQNAKISGDIKIKWNLVKNAELYNVIVKNEKGVAVYLKDTKKSVLTIDEGVLKSDGKYTVFIGSVVGDMSSFSEPVDFEYSISKSTPTVKPISTANPTAKPISTAKPTATAVPTQTPIPTPKPATTEKEKRVFPDGTYFMDSTEAENFMKTIVVDVWDFDSNGEKVKKQKTLVVNTALADDVVSIFDEIFNGEEQFPIRSAGGYCWRNAASGRLSHHSYGTCIDINPNENYYISMSGTVYSGSHWKPYEDKYSIPEDGEVVAIFAKYGWAWGGNAWTSSRDYMHFSYLGN